MSGPHFSSPSQLHENSDTGQPPPPPRRSRSKRTTDFLPPTPRHNQPIHHPRYIRLPSVADDSTAAEQVLGAPPPFTPTLNLNAAMAPPSPPPFPPPFTPPSPLALREPVTRWAPFTTKTPIIIIAISLGIIALYSVGRLMLSGRKKAIVNALRKLHPVDVESGLGWVMIKQGRKRAGRAEDKESVSGLASEESISQSSLEKFLNQKYPQRPCKAVLRCDPLVRRHTMPTLLPSPARKTPPPNRAPSQSQGREVRSLSVPVFPSRRYSGPNPKLYTIDEDEEQGESMCDAPLADLYGIGLDTDSESSEPSEASESNYDSEMASVAHALGAALQYCSSSLDSVSTAGVSPEDTLAAVMALRSGMSSVNVRARTEGRRPRKGSEASSTMTSGDGGDRWLEDAFSDGSTRSSLTSIGSSEEDEVVFEVRRVGTRSTDFKRGMVVSIPGLPGVEKNIPRVFVSESTSYDGRLRYSLADDRKDVPVDLALDDFPRPPVFLDAIERTWTTLSSEIEKTLSSSLAENPFTWKRTASAPALKTVPPPKEMSYVDLIRSGATSMPRLNGAGKVGRSALGRYAYTTVGT